MPEVLIVDDDPDIRGMLSFTLVDLGFDVREATSGRTALNTIQESPPDLIVLDIMLPDLDGREVTQGEPQHASHVRVVVNDQDLAHRVVYRRDAAGC